MRNLLLVISCCLLATGCAASSQLPVRNTTSPPVTTNQPSSANVAPKRSTLPTSFTGVGLSFWSLTDGLMFGSLAELVKNQPRSVVAATHDGGKTWTVNLHVNGVVWGVSTIAQSDAWVSTFNLQTGPQLLFTSNGGHSWMVLNTSTILKNIDFVNASSGWAEEAKPSDEPYSGGNFPYLVHTTDGGKTWTPVPLPRTITGGFSVRALSFTSQTTGWVTFTKRSNGEEERQIYMTTTGGQSWTEIASNSNIKEVLSTMDHVEGMTLDAPNHAVLWTVDGVLLSIGASNHQNTVLYTEPQGVMPGPVTFLSPDKGYELVVKLGQQVSTSQLLMTEDGGKTWTAVKSWNATDSAYGATWFTW